MVDAMQYWGYKAVGVDFAERTIATTSKIAPQLDLNIGDVRKLDYEDCSFDGYWSLGVIEHFWEGYSSILKEMYRVLKPGGFLFLTFPCISPIDRLKIFLSGYKTYTANTVPKDFYQFALNASSVKQDFESQGFKCVYSGQRGGLLGLKRLCPAIAPMEERLSLLSKKKWYFKVLYMGTCTLLAPLCGHGRLMVFQKK